MGGYFWEGDHIRLRAVEPDDWQTFFDWNRDSDGARSSYHVPFPRSAEAARRWATETALRQAEGDVFRWVVENLQLIPPFPVDTEGLDIPPLFAQVLEDTEQLASGGEGDFGVNIDAVAGDELNQAMYDGIQALLTGQSTPQ